MEKANSVTKASTETKVDPILTEAADQLASNDPTLKEERVMKVGSPRKDLI